MTENKLYHIRRESDAVEVSHPVTDNEVGTKPVEAQTLAEVLELSAGVELSTKGIVAALTALLHRQAAIEAKIDSLPTSEPDYETYAQLIADQVSKAVQAVDYDKIGQIVAANSPEVNVEGATIDAEAIADSISDKINEEKDVFKLITAKAGGQSLVGRFNGKTGQMDLHKSLSDMDKTEVGVSSYTPTGEIELLSMDGKPLPVSFYQRLEALENNSSPDGQPMSAEEAIAALKNIAG